MRRRGLSLAEVLVCIAIILILMAMAFPAYFKAMRKAETTRDQSNERYRDDHPRWNLEEDAGE